MISVRTCTFFGLNAVRFLSIVAMLLVFSSNILIMVRDIQAVKHFVNAGINGDSTMADSADCDCIDTVPNQPTRAVWAVLNRILVLVLLLASEMSWPISFFNRFFPILGDGFGLGALGIIQTLISASILSHHVDDFPFVSAFFLFAIACLNMLLGLLYRESAKSKRSIRAWRAATANTILPTHIQVEQTRHVHVDQAPQHPSFGFGRQGEKKAGLKGFLISRPLESLPRYANPPAPLGPRSSSPRAL